MGGVEYQVTKVDPTDPETKGMVYQVHKVTEEVAATLGGKVYRARIIKDPTDPTVAGKVYQIVLIGDPSDPAVKGKVYNAILTGGSEAVIVGPAVAPLSLPDAIANSLSYVKAFGGTEQSGTPTPDAPIDIVSNNGVLKVSPNLFNKNDITTTTVSDVTISVDADGTITADGTSSNPNYSQFVFPLSTPISEGTYTVSLYNSETLSAGSLVGFAINTTVGTRGASLSTVNTVKTITVDSGEVCNNVIIRIAGTANQFKFKIQIEKGDQSTAYHPYNSVYADGTVETIAIKNNIFTLVGATYDETIGGTGTPGSSPNNGYSDYLAVTSGDVYNFSDRGLSGVALYDQDKVFQDRPSVRVGDYTIPAGIAYIRVNFRQSVMNNVSITHTNYTATAEMLLKVGDYQDVQSILDGVVTRNVGVKVLVGTELWSYYSVSQGNMFRITIADSVQDDKGVLEVLCNSYEVVSYSQRTNGTLSGASRNYDFINNNYTTLEDWKQYLAEQYAAGTPVIVVYPLETETTENVTGQTLQVTQGDNVLEITQASLDNLELEAQYEKEPE